MRWQLAEMLGKEHFQRGFAIRKLYSVIWGFTSCNTLTQVLCAFFFESLHFLVAAQSQFVPLESSLDSNSSQFLSCKNLSSSAVKSNCRFNTFVVVCFHFFPSQSGAIKTAMLRDAFGI